MYGPGCQTVGHRGALLAIVLFILLIIIIGPMCV